MRINYTWIIYGLLVSIRLSSVEAVEVIHFGSFISWEKPNTSISDKNLLIALLSFWNIFKLKSEVQKTYL